MTRYAAFLRAMNVGGTTLIGKDDLRKAFERLGTDVRTYIQSGNVAFTTDKPLGKVQEEAAAAVRNLGGTDVMVRTQARLQELVRKGPAGYVTFLASPGKVASIPGLRVVLVDGCDVLTERTPAPKPVYPGVHIEKTLRITSTTRNWNTLVKMAWL